MYFLKNANHLAITRTKFADLENGKFESRVDRTGDGTEGKEGVEGHYDDGT